MHGVEYTPASPTQTTYRSSRRGHNSSSSSSGGTAHSANHSPSYRPRRRGDRSRGRSPSSRSRVPPNPPRKNNACQSLETRGRNRLLRRGGCSLSSFFRGGASDGNSGSVSGGAG